MAVSDESETIGREVFTLTPKRWGRVIALIHKADGIEVLIEHRSWFRRHASRVPLTELSPTEDGQLLLKQRPPHKPTQLLPGKSR